MRVGRVGSSCASSTAVVLPNQGQRHELTVPDRGRPGLGCELRVLGVHQQNMFYILPYSSSTYICTSSTTSPKELHYVAAPGGALAQYIVVTTKSSQLYYHHYNYSPLVVTGLGSTGFEEVDGWRDGSQVERQVLLLAAGDLEGCLRSAKGGRRWRGNCHQISRSCNGKWAGIARPRGPAAAPLPPSPSQQPGR